MTLRFLMLSSLCAGAVALAGEPHAKDTHAAPHWTYEGAEGPTHWGELSKEFKACASGTSQSPIDLAKASGKDLPNLIFDYRPSPLAFTNNGHTLQQSFGTGSTLRSSGKKFELVQLHFHHPSEHTVDGRAFPLEVHLVHRSAKGELAVVGVLYEEGAENPALAALWKDLPVEAGALKTGELQIDPIGFVPANRAYFAYPGSLTTPPCSEGVKWHVLKEPLTASKVQLEAFAKLFENNARPVMPLNKRTVALDATP